VIPLEFLPTVNAMLNGTSAVLLLTGYWLIRRGKVTAHKTCMLTALVVSALFLVSYVYYHVHEGRTCFSGAGWIRLAYFALLGSHTVLAGAVVPLAIVTAGLGLRGSYARHARIARWTFPIWVYVSATGVLVYVVLYHMYPAR
jgi:uncharacterized membrane protein YozB (DUF420 family)